MDAQIDMPGVFFKAFGKLLMRSFRTAIERDHVAMKVHFEGTNEPSGTT